MSFRCIFGDLDLLWGPHAPARGQVALGGRDEARARLGRLAAEPDDLAQLRRLVAEEVGHDLIRMTDAEVVDLAAGLVETRRLVLCRTGSMDGGDASPGAGAGQTQQLPSWLETPPEVPPKADKPGESEEVTWYEIRVVDELGEPIAGVPLVLDAGGAHPLVTAGDGCARLDGAYPSFGHVRIEDLAALRELLRPRWDVVRPGDCLEAEQDHSFVALRGTGSVVRSVLSETPHTLVIQPWVIRARLVGLYFDTSKCFLLPTALSDIKKLKRLYDDYPDSAVLVVGHTDKTADPSYNDPLSLERADSVAAYLRDDAEAWLSWYGAGKSWEKRWGAKEDHLMLASLPDYATRPSGESEIRWYQQTRGLTADGWAGEQTRRQLIAEYMAHDETTLPSSATLTTHGCGESFPFTEAELAELDLTGADPNQRDRRVELYFFDRDLGVQPPPPGPISGPGGQAYPEWGKRARETHDFDLLRATQGPLWIRLSIPPAEAPSCYDVVRVRSASGTLDMHATVATACTPNEQSVDLHFGDVPIDELLTVEVIDATTGAVHAVASDAPYETLHDGEPSVPVEMDGTPSSAPATNWRRTGKALPGPSRAGANVHLWRRIQSATLRVVEFLDDFGELTPRNRPGWDYAAGGARYVDVDEAHYRAGRGESNIDGDLVTAIHPAHVPRGATPEVYVELDVFPADAVAESGSIVARARPGGEGTTWWPELRAATTLLDPTANPNTPLPLVATSPLPNGPLRISDLYLDWEVEFQGTTLKAGTTGPHEILVIYDQPWASRHADAPWLTNPLVREYGITAKRTVAAVKLVHAALLSKWGTFEDVGTKPLIEAIHAAYPRYRLVPPDDMTDEYLQATSPEPPDRRNVGYMGNVVGGGWPHIDYPGVGAECQALVRLVDGILRQLGAEGSFLRGVIYANPNVESGMRALFHPFVDEPQGLPIVPPIRFIETTYADDEGEEVTAQLKSYCNLVTHELAVKGRVYAFASLGINTYEAVLRVETSGTLLYYAGGSGVFTGGDDDDLQHEVLQTAFRAMVYWAYHPQDSTKVVVTDVIAYY